MAEDQIRYDVLVQEALRGVVRKVLTEAAQAGLPGEHHFYIAFDTAAPGVRISSRIRQKYPEEMTIVLQHQFWDFVVSETHFEVSLSFGGISERLVIPFTAVKGFFDPSVQFGLQFDPARNRDAAEASSSGGTPATEGPKPSLASSEGRKVVGEKVTSRASVPATAGPKAVPVAAKADGEKSATSKPSPAKPSADKPEGAAPKPEVAAVEPAPGAAVVSLDAFRKKT
jgi:hypothetical protein